MDPAKGGSNVADFSFRARTSGNSKGSPRADLMSRSYNRDQQHPYQMSQGGKGINTNAAYQVTAKFASLK